MLLLVAGLATAGFIYLWSRQGRRLSVLAEAARELAEGNLARRIILPGTDGPSQVAHYLNRLADQVQTRLAEDRRSLEWHKRLLTDISHDLRTPITSLSGYLDAMMRGLDDPTGKYLGIVWLKAQEIVELTNDLFYQARVDSGDLSLRSDHLDLAEVLRQVVLGFEPALTHDRVAVSLAIPDARCMAVGDESAVRRILSNIIANSVRHGTGKTCLRVTLDDEGESHRIVISDNGKGFSEGLDRLLERGAAAGRGGAGLGLSIAKELASLQGIDMTARSKAYEDTSFILDFPKT
jgi:signal transduction histidine kinase